MKLASRDKKQLILDAAETLFDRYGYSKTSIDDIAKEAFLGKGTIYYYFESKEDIFFEVVQIQTDKFMKKIRKSIDEAKDFETKLYLTISLPIRMAHEHSTNLLDVLKNFPLQYMHKLKDIRDRSKHHFIDILNDIIQGGIKSNIVSDTIPVNDVLNVIYDWFLLGDSNIIIQNHAEFLEKAEKNYKWVVQLLLYGLIKRGN